MSSAATTFGGRPGDFAAGDFTGAAFAAGAFTGAAFAAGVFAAGAFTGAAFAADFGGRPGRRRATGSGASEGVRTPATAPRRLDSGARRSVTARSASNASSPLAIRATAF
ncbi:hypothetical protein D7V77_06895 [Corallococcus sp. CA041A]|nr:hypothetical protein D7V77_06895 [Corallococcus sp. CA041A]